jgi:hypothetical protein
MVEEVALESDGAPRRFELLPAPLQRFGIAAESGGDEKDRAVRSNLTHLSTQY